ncbi:MAG: peptide-methionine (S)-S-oxide reductase, partial [Chitinophagaceae bacterium]|nr:peptide-methionine (S)-S-oxide reductase [Chitinophagaceae bacterium]
MKPIFISAFAGLTALVSCAQKPAENTKITNSSNNIVMEKSITTQTDTATFANGCFWC